MNLRELFATFGLNFDSSGVDKAEGGIQRLWTAVKSFGAALASTAIVQGIWNFVSGIADAADNVGDLSARTGVASGSLQRIGAALGTVGVDLTSTAKLLETMNLKLNDAANGGRAAAAFQRLGVDVRDANGQLRSSEAVFLDVTDRVSEMGSSAERTAALVSIFGGRGRALAALLAGGNSQIRDMVEAMGGLEGITQDVIDGSGELETQTTVLDFAMTSLKSQIARELLPVVIDVVTWFLKVAKGFNAVARRSNILKAGIAVLGGAMVFWGLATIEAWGPAVLTFLGVALAVAAVVAIVDDIITLFSGGQSVLGDFIDEMYGVGTSAEFVEGVKLAWEELVTWLGDAWDTAAGLTNDYIQWTDEMAASTSESLSAIGAFFTNLWTTISGVVASIRDAFMSVWNDPMGAAETFWNWIVGFVQERVSAIGGAVSGFLNRITGGAIGSAQSTTSSPRTAARPPAAGGGGTTTVVNNTASAPITIVGNPSAEERRRLQAMVSETMDARNREAQAALVPTPAE